MKTKKYTIICTAVSLVILIAVIVLALIKANKPAAKPDEASNTSSTASDVVVEIGNIEETESGGDNNSSDNVSFIEPDETEADKLLNSEEGIVVDDVREGEDSIQDLWEILNHELYGGKQILPFRYEFHAN